MQDVIALIIITIISTIIVLEIVRIWLKCSHKELWEFYKNELHIFKIENIFDGIANFSMFIFSLVQLLFWIILLGIAITFLVALLES